MGTVGNSPSQQTYLALEARKSFALGLNFKRLSGDLVDVTGATVRMVVAQPPHLGGLVVLTATAVAIEPTFGAMQIALQAADLDLSVGEYPFDVTYVSAEGYSTPVLKGVIDLRANTDLDSTNVYAGVNPATQLAAYLENGSVVEVRVDDLEGFAVAAANSAADAAGSATAAQTAANEARAIAIGDLDPTMSLVLSDPASASHADVVDISTGVVSGQRGAASGVAPLDAGSKVPAANLPGVALTSRLVIHVKEYGAVGDGVADDTTAVQAAINALKAVAVTDPPLSRPVVLDGQGGTYKITNSLNLAGIQLGRGWEIRNLHLVAACAGKIAMDLSGSRFGHLTNVHVWGDQTSQPHTGIALSRTTTSPCDRFVLNNCTLDGYFTSSALHLNASEELTFDSCVFANRRVADGGGEAWAVILDGAGFKSVPSLYAVPSNTRQSFTVIKFDRCAIQKPFSVAGPTMFMQEVASLTFDACYLTNGSGSGIVWRLTSGFVPYRIRMDFQQETSGTDRFILFQSDASAAREVRGLHITFGNLYADQEVISWTGFPSLILRSFKCHLYRMATGVTLANKMFNPAAGVTIQDADIVVPAASDFNSVSSFAAIDGKVTAMDGTKLLLENGWTDFFPGWGLGTGSVGDGTQTGRYMKNGRTVHFAITLTAGASTVFGSGAWTLNLPVAAHANAIGNVFQARLRDASGPIVFPAVLDLTSAAAGIFRCLPATAGGAYVNVAPTSPFTWTNGDSITVVGTYEAAA